MEKTAKEWFEEFPEPYRTQALDNADKELLNFKFSSALEAVKGTFFWDDSPERHDYWHDFKHQLLKEGK